MALSLSRIHQLKTINNTCVLVCRCTGNVYPYRGRTYYRTCSYSSKTFIPAPTRSQIQKHPHREAFSLKSISYLARVDECQYQFKGTKGQNRTGRNSFCNRFLNSNVTIIYKRPWVPKRWFSSLSHCRLKFLMATGRSQANCLSLLVVATKFTVWSFWVKLKLSRLILK